MEPPSPLDRHAVNPMAAWDQVQRVSEPWYITKIVALVGGFIFAMVLAYLAATGQFELLIVVGVWVIACLVIVFVRDYWWAPALVVTALSLQTAALGFKLTGLEVGMVILGLTFPVKMAMKTLWPARPRLEAGIWYWGLVGFLAVHAIVIFFYNKIDATPQIKNIVKAYYGAIAPMALYGMLLQYCNSKTVLRTCATVFAVWLGTATIAMFIVLFNIQMPDLTMLKIDMVFIKSPEDAAGFMRLCGPYLFIGAMAYWPAARSTFCRFVLAFAGTLGIVGILFSGGRTVLGCCFAAAAFFAVVRKRVWLALPVTVVAAVAIGVCTLLPDFMYSLPEGIQRAMAPLNFSDQKTEVQNSLAESDHWHQDLRVDSLTYWNQDTNSFLLGHGFKGWDDAYFSSGDLANQDYETHKQFAIEMGHTENMFSSITNIFGLAGLVLYGGFLVGLAIRLWKARASCPEKSAERAICEFSFVNLVTTIALMGLNGGVPDINIVYWALGLLAARPFIGIPEPIDPMVAPTFDISRRPSASPKGAAAGPGVPRGLPQGQIASSRARMPIPGTGRAS